MFDHFTLLTSNAEYEDNRNSNSSGTCEAMRGYEVDVLASSLHPRSGSNTIFNSTHELTTLLNFTCARNQVPREDASYAQNEKCIARAVLHQRNGARRCSSHFCSFAPAR